MATNLGRKIIRKVTARRFAGGTGGNLRLSSGLAAAREHSSNNGFSFLETAFLVFHSLPDVRFCIALAGGVWWFTKTMEDSSKASASKAAKEFNAAMTKPLEERGVSRELLEANIAKLKEKTESGSASGAERFRLQIYEGWLEWLELFTRGE